MHDRSETPPQSRLHPAGTSPPNQGPGSHGKKSHYSSGAQTRASSIGKDPPHISQFNHRQSSDQHKFKHFISKEKRSAETFGRAFSGLVSFRTALWPRTEADETIQHLRSRHGSA